MTIGTVQLLQLAQGVSAVAWGAALLFFLPSLFRLLTSRRTVFDSIGALIAVYAETQVEFIARWFVYPHAISAMTEAELSWWLSLYVRSAVTAIVAIAAAAAVRPRPPQ